MSTVIAITATPAKLRDGSWGARVSGVVPAVGEVVTIRTAAGKTWQARVTCIISSHGNDHVVGTQSMDRAPASSSSSSREERLLDRGLIEVRGPRGNYVRKMTRDEWHDEI